MVLHGIVNAEIWDDFTGSHPPHLPPLPSTTTAVITATSVTIITILSTPPSSHCHPTINCHLHNCHHYLQHTCITTPLTTAATPVSRLLSLHPDHHHQHPQRYHHQHRHISRPLTSYCQLRMPWSFISTKESYSHGQVHDLPPGTSLHCGAVLTVTNSSLDRAKFCFHVVPNPTVGRVLFFS